jgi:hypothetical protein
MPARTDPIEILRDQLRSLDTRMTNHEQSLSALGAKQVGLERDVKSLQANHTEKKENWKFWVAVLLPSGLLAIEVLAHALKLW